jgi:ATP-dependent helicase STH1/SNF2
MGINMKSGRRIAEIFEELPDEEEYPDYYEVIDNPIALDTMKQRIDGGEYKSVDDFEADLILMVDNAKTFNEPESQVHVDAMEIMVCYFHC